MGLISIIAQARARLHAFVPGTTAKSGEVGAEFDQLVNSYNDLVGDVDNLNTAMDTVTGPAWDGVTLMTNKDAINTHKASADHDGRYFTETEVNALLATRDSNLTTHKASADHDGRYFTETEINAFLATRDANLNTHKTSGDHDTRYYTKTQADLEFVSHSEINVDANIDLIYEVFTIVNPDLGDGTFSYTDENSTLRISALIEGGTYQAFSLLKGDYTIGDNRVEAIINDTLHRSVPSGGLMEINSNEVAVLAEGAGAEITIKYFTISGSLGSSIVMGTQTPLTAYPGKLWIDTN